MASTVAPAVAAGSLLLQLLLLTADINEPQGESLVGADWAVLAGVGAGVGVAVAAGEDAVAGLEAEADPPSSVTCAPPTPPLSTAAGSTAGDPGVTSPHTGDPAASSPTAPRLPPSLAEGAAFVVGLPPKSWADPRIDRTMCVLLLRPALPPFFPPALPPPPLTSLLLLVAVPPAVLFRGPVAPDGDVSRYA